MTIVQELAEAVAIEIAAALEPLQRKIADLEVSRTSWIQKFDQAQGMIWQLEQRLAAAEARPLLAGPAGPSGPQGLPGKDGRDGLDGKDGAPGLNGKDGSPGLNGKDGAPGLDGKDGAAGLDGKEGAPGLNGKDGRDGLDGKDGARGLDGKDGIGVAGALLTKDCNLVLTLSDGSVRDLGCVRGARGTDGLDGKDGARGLDGKDGRDGMPGVPGRPGDRGQDGEHGLDGKSGAPGRDGKDGRDGLNGLGIDDLVFDEAKGWIVKSGDREFRYPLPFDAGVWQPGRLYPKGAIVTAKGALQIAQRDTRARPGDEFGETRDWRLAVRAGKDGKPGPPGRDGNDG